MPGFGNSPTRIDSDTTRFGNCPGLDSETLKPAQIQKLPRNMDSETPASETAYTWIRKITHWHGFRNPDSETRAGFGNFHSGLDSETQNQKLGWDSETPLNTDWLPGCLAGWLGVSQGAWLCRDLSGWLGVWQAGLTDLVRVCAWP